MSELRRRMMVQQGGGGGVLPPEYQQVEWLQGDGVGAYIDPSWTTSTTGSLLCEVAFTLRRYQCTGTAEGLGVSRFLFGIEDNGQRAMIGIGNVIKIDYIFELEHLYTFKIDLLNKEYGIEEFGYLPFTGSFNDRRLFPFYLFARWRDWGPVDSFCDFKMRRCTLSSDGITPDRIMLPCYRKADDEPGMYDIVNDVFYTNAGSGSFVVGPDVA